MIREVQASGVVSLRKVAAVLNARGVRTARGGRWFATQVGAVLERAPADDQQQPSSTGCRATCTSWPG